MSYVAQDQSTIRDMGGLANLPGLDTVRDQLAAVIAAIEAERARVDAGIPVTRRRWKNLVFTGGPGTGKSRTAEPIARIYHDLGVVTSGHLTEVSSTELTDLTAEGTAHLVREAISTARGGVLLLTDAQAYASLEPRHQQAPRSIQDGLAQFRDDLIVILAGETAQLHTVLRRNLALATRFPATIDFPGYTPGHLAEIFATLANEAGFTLTAAATHKASAVLEEAHCSSASGNARLAVELLDQTTANQALRMAKVALTREPAQLGTICGTDIPGHVLGTASADDRCLGQYL
jgi:AAA lid domain/ATPase family associated with various cellular activities (AAA)